MIPLQVAQCPLPGRNEEKRPLGIFDFYMASTYNVAIVFLK